MSDSRLIAFDDLPLQEIEKWASKIKNPNRTMILHTHSDASYLSEPKARSRAGGIHYLSNRQYDNVDNINGAILVISQIMKNLLSSAAEAELGALFINCVDAVAIRTMLTELGHQQPATPVQTDNSTAEGIVNRTVKQRRSKAIDMRYYWLQDRAEQGQFNIFWRRGIDNHADYFTKHHPPSHHRAKRPLYINNLRELQALRSQYTI